jgi:hypothetical protein
MKITGKSFELIKKYQRTLIVLNLIHFAVIIGGMVTIPCFWTVR